MGCILIWPAGIITLFAFIALIINIHKVLMKKLPKYYLVWPILLFIAGCAGIYWSATNFIYM